ncbi:MAG: hypothetical protein CMJ94_12630 [Planctomycetes bacterium]|nr:hypothetical protein [Planctomycetota bacterium]
MASPTSSIQAALAAVCLILSACGSEKPQAVERPHVLLIVVDTLRADALPAYGGARPVPGIDRLAAEGVTVDGLVACTSWTVPSMATLFTGLSPAEHRVMRMVGAGSNLLETRTLASAFRDQGYATGCIMSNFLLAQGKGFEEGYDFYDDRLARRPDPHRGITSPEVTDRGLAWLDQVPADQPWFLTLHYFDPHTSYEDHPEVDYLDPAYTGWVRGGLSDPEYKAQQALATAADQAQLRALYDEEVWAVGHAIERVLQALEDRGALKNTLVVFTADHGEELAERGYIGHTRTLHFEQIELPLIVRFPDGSAAGERRAGAMAQQDVYATVLGLAGLGGVEERGVSRAAWIRTEADSPAAGLLFAEVDFVPVKDDPARRILKRSVEKRDATGARIGKLVLDRKSGEESLWVDAGERVNRLVDPQHAALLTELREALAAHIWYSP